MKRLSSSGQNTLNFFTDFKLTSWKRSQIPSSSGPISAPHFTGIKDRQVWWWIGYCRIYGVLYWRPKPHVLGGSIPCLPLFRAYWSWATPDVRKEGTQKNGEPDRPKSHSISPGAKSCYGVLGTKTPETGDLCG